MMSCGLYFIKKKKKKKKQKYELYHLGLMSRHFGPLSLVKTRREGKGKGGREGGGKEREKGKKNTRSYLVCKREMERNIIFWWVPPSQLSLLSPFPPKLGGKNLVGH